MTLQFVVFIAPCIMKSESDRLIRSAEFIEHKKRVAVITYHLNEVISEIIDFLIFQESHTTKTI